MRQRVLKKQTQFPAEPSARPLVADWVLLCSSDGFAPVAVYVVRVFDYIPSPGPSWPAFCWADVGPAF